MDCECEQACCQCAKRAWIITGGIDYTSAYYRRGYLQDDSGLILQPFLTAARRHEFGDSLTAHPYVTSWNSFGLLDLDDPMAIMVEGMGGVFFTADKLNLDVNYAYFNNAPADEDSDLQEISLKLSYDVSRLWTGAEAPTFALRPSATLSWETYDQLGSEDGYLELGVEPAWRFAWGCRNIGVTLPVQVGMSLDDYYFDAAGAEEFVGHVTAGLSVSTSLPPVGPCQNWFLTASIYYSRLLADNLIAINGGEPNVLLGKVGLGFSF